MTATQNDEITLEKIVAVRDILRKHTKGWAKLLGAKMFPDLDPQNQKDKIYNIIHGSTRDQETRMLFIVSSEELIGEFSAKKTIVKKSLNNLLKIKS